MEENITLKVKGMFCVGCESRIQRVVSKVDGVKKVKVSFNSGEVNIIFDKNKVSQEILENVIKDLDYDIIKDNNKINSQAIYFLIIIVALYIIFNHLGWLNIFNIFPTIQTTMSYGMLFVVGLLTSFHCIAMCGGINLSQSVATARKNGNIIKSNLLYNLGRVISYTIIGGIVGLIGSVITLGGIFKGIVAIVAGIVMIIMAINMLSIFPKLRNLNIKLPNKVINFLDKSKKGKSSFYIGLVNGLMPCGPLQSMQIYALSTGSFFGGAFSMFLFSLGTVPLMFTFGIISSKLNKKFARVMLTVSSFIIFILGLSMLGNGLTLSGVNISINDTSNQNMAEIVGDYQEVVTEIDYGSYEAITVRSGIPVRWTIIVPEGKLTGCNNEIIIPKYNIDIELKVGENIIEFIPTDVGTVTYSCWMGMIKSYIKVID